MKKAGSEFSWPRYRKDRELIAEGAATCGERCEGKGCARPEGHSGDHRDSRRTIEWHRPDRNERAFWASADAYDRFVRRTLKPIVAPSAIEDVVSDLRRHLRNRVLANRSVDEFDVESWGRKFVKRHAWARR